MRRVVLKTGVRTRTSGPIPTSAAGIWLRDRAQPVVMFRVEQLGERCGDD